MVDRRQALRGGLAVLAGAAAGACGRSPRVSIPGVLVDSSAGRAHRALAAAAQPPALHRSARVVVVGAGIAGLAAAYALRRAGVRDVLLLDALDTAGGNSSSGRNEVSAFPWGAHYVPLVRADCGPVLELFRDLRIIVDLDARGRPVYDDYALLADPQERLWLHGRWQEGLVPQVGGNARDRAQFGAFFAETERLKSLRGSDGKPPFAIPIDASSADPQWRALDSITMAEYLRRRGWDSPLLRWYVNYCCRDDYGSSAGAVSAWAGLHYFSSRNGIAANADPTTVVTWPEGNGYLARELERRAAAELRCNCVVTRVAARGAAAELDYFDAALGALVRVEAAAAVVCLPRFVAARVVEGLDRRGIDSFSYAPWMVANLTLRKLPGGRGWPLAWDNVIFDSPLLGYVVATHQGLEQARSSTVLTYYWPLSDQEPPDARRTALARPLEEWQQRIVGDLLRVNPELEGSIENIDVRVWGHAMIRPTPGFIWGEARRRAAQARPPLYFAHSDLSGISIFEEAYCRGTQAGAQAAAYLDGRALPAAA